MYITIILCTILVLSSCSTVRLSNFEASDCKNNCKSGLISYKVIGNKTTIFYGAGGACCLKFKGKIKYINDTLFLTSISTTDGCMCLCGYEFHYFIKGLKNKNPIIKYNTISSKKLIKLNDKRKKINSLMITNSKKYNKIQNKLTQKEVNKYKRIDAKKNREKFNNLDMNIDDVYR